jgi:hypothetical protein
LSEQPRLKASQALIRRDSAKLLAKHFVFQVVQPIVNFVLGIGCAEGHLLKPRHSFFVYT